MGVVQHRIAECRKNEKKKQREKDWTRACKFTYIYEQKKIKFEALCASFLLSHVDWLVHGWNRFYEKTKNVNNETLFSFVIASALSLKLLPHSLHNL